MNDDQVVPGEAEEVVSSEVEFEVQEVEPANSEMEDVELEDSIISTETQEVELEESIISNYDLAGLQIGKLKNK